MEFNEEYNLREEMSQLKYDNMRLKDEINSVKNYYETEEEAWNRVHTDLKAALTKKNEQLMRYEGKITNLVETVKLKEELVDMLEEKLRKKTELNEELKMNLQAANREKAILLEEVDEVTARESVLVEKEAGLKKEVAEERRRVNCLKEEFCNLLGDLHRQVLKERKVELEQQLLAFIEESSAAHPPRNDDDLSHDSYDVSSAHNCQKNIEENAFYNDSIDSKSKGMNLLTEFLLAEIHEFETLIESQTENFRGVEGKICESNGWVVSGVEPDSGFTTLIFSCGTMSGEYERWSEGQSGETNPLTEAPDSVKVKESVINAQPVSSQIVESVSIATQTDRILLAKALEEFSPLQNVLDHKYSDIDMDLYRSYRKLSILPEEDDDETLKRIPSLKNAINSKSLSAKLPQTYKTHSADDILSFEIKPSKTPATDKLISSCTNIIFRDNLLDDVSARRRTDRNSPKPDKKSGYTIICDNNGDSFKSERRRGTASDEPRVDSTDLLRQPHSFDSYLDPEQIPTASLPRQISDPMQSAQSEQPLTRRGSYLKRPRSTCRPLRLPCDDKREERVSKVRFDLSNNGNSKLIDNINGSKGPTQPPLSNLKNHRKIERVSRFTVERVDEDEFRRSIDESNKTAANRKRPPLVHSVVYKKSVLHDMTVYDPESDSVTPDQATVTSGASITGSPESPSYETATESSPVDSFDMTTYESNYLIADIYPCKRRKQSDSSSYSIESQDSIDGNDILVKSIRLHHNSEYITMKELDRDSSTSSHLSVDMDIPYIDAEELPVIKQSPEIKTGFSEDALTPTEDELRDENNKSVDSRKESPPKADSFINQSDSSETFMTACSDATPTSDVPETSPPTLSLSPPKFSGLSKSPTVLKNLANFELYNTVSESIAGKIGSTTIRSQVVEEAEEENEDDEEVGAKSEDDHDEEEEESTILKLTSSDVSEMSDTVTYVTVKSDPSNALLSSDCESDTYVTLHSDKSTLERKFSDLSENSSSPYNTPPDTSSASFCTPPDTYSPIMSRLAKRLAEGDFPRTQVPSSSVCKNPDSSHRDHHPAPPQQISRKYDTPPRVSPFSSLPCSSPLKSNNPGLPDRDAHPKTESVTMNTGETNYPSESSDSRERKESIIFDSPKLEFYETNDSIENLEKFLKSEEGLQELVKTPIASNRSWMCSTLEDLQEEPATIDERKNSDGEEGSFRGGALSKTNSLESPSGVGDTKFFEKRSKRHPPLSRQNSTEDYNFLEPHDSCLNLSEEISSPSTTPDTSNKTVIFKNKPLTVSNTIDLDDDDFPISESEIQINFNGSETEIVEIAVGKETSENTRNDMFSCQSEPCIPSISSSADLLMGLPKQSSSVTEEGSPESGGLAHKSDHPTVPPEIIVSNLSSESENDSDAGGILIDFASNVSDRSEVNLSDLNSISGHSDNAFSNSDPSENLTSERSPEIQITDPEVSLSVSPEVSDNSSSSSPPQIRSNKDFDADLGKALALAPASTSFDDGAPQEERLYIDISERVAESRTGNLVVVDLPGDDVDCGVGGDSTAVCCSGEASLCKY